MKSRWWVFTNFNLELDWDLLFQTEDNVKFIAYAVETCPTTQRVHQQGWAYFSNPRARTAGILPNMHCEIMRGNLAQNNAYCEKQNKLITFGREPRQGERRDIAEVFEAIRGGATELELAEANPPQFCQYGRRFEDYRRLLVPKRTWKTEVKVFWGEPGSGKTRRAWDLLGGFDGGVAVSYTAGGFFLGYNGEDRVLIDDFDGAIPRDLFLQLTDRYPLLINIKNGCCHWCPKLLIITSNSHPSSWYDDFQAILRRLSSVEQMLLKGNSVALLAAG